MVEDLPQVGDHGTKWPKSVRCIEGDRGVFEIRCFCDSLQEGRKRRSCGVIWQGESGRLLRQDLVFQGRSRWASVRGQGQSCIMNRCIRVELSY